MKALSSKKSELWLRITEKASLAQINAVTFSQTLQNILCAAVYGLETTFLHARRFQHYNFEINYTM